MDVGSAFFVFFFFFFGRRRLCICFSLIIFVCLGMQFYFFPRIGKNFSLNIFFVCIVFRMAWTLNNSTSPSSSHLIGRIYVPYKYTIYTTKKCGKIFSLFCVVVRHHCYFSLFCMRKWKKWQKKKYAKYESVGSGKSMSVVAVDRTDKLREK